MMSFMLLVCASVRTEALSTDTSFVIWEESVKGGGGHFPMEQVPDNPSVHRAEMHHGVVGEGGRRGEVGGVNFQR